MRTIMYFDKNKKVGQALVIMHRVKPNRRLFEVVTVTSMRSYPKAGKGLVLNSTRTNQYFSKRDAAFQEYERQLGRLEYSGWVRKVLANAGSNR